MLSGTIVVAPTDILIDSATPRPACYVVLSPPEVRMLQFFGDGTFDPFQDNVEYALEYDAYSFVVIYAP